MFSVFLLHLSLLSRSSFDQNSEIRHLCLSFLLCSLSILSQPQQHQISAWVQAEVFKYLLSGHCSVCCLSTDEESCRKLFCASCLKSIIFKCNFSHTYNNDIVFCITFYFPTLIRHIDLSFTTSGLSHNNSLSITIVEIIGKLMTKSRKNLQYLKCL